MALEMAVASWSVGGRTPELAGAVEELCEELGVAARFFVHRGEPPATIAEP